MIFMDNNLPIDKIICGDSATILKHFPDNSINLVITSPPYFQQREYGGGEIGGEHSVDEYIAALMEVFSECVRITKEDGNIVFNLGDKYQNGSLLLVPYRFALKSMEKQKVALVNNITWVKTNPTPRQFNRRLVPSTEQFFHFVKSKSYYYNLDAFYELPLEAKTKQTSLRSENNGNTKIGENYRKLIASSELSAEEKRNAYRELDEVVNEVISGKIFSFRMKIRGIHSPAFGGQSGGRASQIKNMGYTIIRMYGKKLHPDVVLSAVETLKGYRHPAVYPQVIIENFIKLLTKPGDIVLDPFTGSGTTEVAAKLLNRHYIGIDINPAYVSMAEERLKKELFQYGGD